MLGQAFVMDARWSVVLQIHCVLPTHDSRLYWLGFNRSCLLQPSSLRLNRAKYSTEMAMSLLVFWDSFKTQLEPAQSLPYFEISKQWGFRQPPWNDFLYMRVMTNWWDAETTLSVSLYKRDRSFFQLITRFLASVRKSLCRNGSYIYWQHFSWGSFNASSCGFAAYSNVLWEVTTKQGLIKTAWFRSIGPESLPRDSTW